jgi:hypothetical protein
MHKPDTRLQRRWGPDDVIDDVDGVLYAYGAVAEAALLSYIHILGIDGIATTNRTTPKTSRHQYETCLVPPFGPKLATDTVHVGCRDSSLDTSVR